MFVKKIEIVFLLMALGINMTSLHFGAGEAQAQAGGGGSGASGRGGGTVMDQDEALIRLYLANEANYLKRSLVNYLDTIRLSEVSDARILALLSGENGISALKADVGASTYKLGDPDTCLDHDGEVRSASARIGDRGGEICFDPGRLAAELRGRSPVEVMIGLAGITLHEHRHHLQAWPANANIEALKQLEEEALALGAYVVATAKNSQIPVLEWQPQQGELAIELLFELEGELTGAPNSFVEIDPSREYPPALEYWRSYGTLGTIYDERPRLTEQVRRALSRRAEIREKAITYLERSRELQSLRQLYPSGVKVIVRYRFMFVAGFWYGERVVFDLRLTYNQLNTQSLLTFSAEQFLTDPLKPGSIEKLDELIRLEKKRREPPRLFLRGPKGV